MDVVDKAEDAAGLDLPPLVVREPLEAFLDAHGIGVGRVEAERIGDCLLYTSPSPRDGLLSRMPSSA